MSESVTSVGEVWNVQPQPLNRTGDPATIYIFSWYPKK